MRGVCLCVWGSLSKQHRQLRSLLAFTETWLSASVETDDLMLESYNKPERKDRVGDPHGGVMLYVKETIFYKRREDLEIRGLENI